MTINYKAYHVLFALFITTVVMAQTQHLPKGFVYVDQYIPDLDVELKYYSTHNFVGDTIIGYHANRLILTRETALKLQSVQQQLQQQNLCLKVYDGYRPQRAVNHFVAWAKQLADTVNKKEFYPKVNKRHLFKLGYIASKSGHSRGSTVDVTIVDGNTGEPLDMGSPYDFFGETSWINHPKITKIQQQNRALLQRVMLANNFRNYSKEWWHFTLRWEPFPKTYFDFLVQ